MILLLFLERLGIKILNESEAELHGQSAAPMLVPGRVVVPAVRPYFLENVGRHIFISVILFRNSWGEVISQTVFISFLKLGEK